MTKVSPKPTLYSFPLGHSMFIPEFLAIVYLLPIPGWPFLHQPDPRASLIIQTTKLSLHFSKCTGFNILFSFAQVYFFPSLNFLTLLLLFLLHSLKYRSKFPSRATQNVLNPSMTSSLLKAQIIFLKRFVSVTDNTVQAGLFSQATPNASFSCSIHCVIILLLPQNWTPFLSTFS